jgi:hypothetical protein
MAVKREKWRIGSLICTTPERLRGVIEVFYEPTRETLMAWAETSDNPNPVYVHFAEPAGDGPSNESRRIATGVTPDECRNFISFVEKLTGRKFFSDDISSDIRAWRMSDQPVIHTGQTPPPVVIASA